MPQLSSTLLQSFASKNSIVPFVGAGVSMAVLDKQRERAFPDWSELLLRGATAVRDGGDEQAASLIERLVESMRAPESDEDPLAIADRIAKKLKGEGWTNFLRSQFNIDRRDVLDDSLKLPEAVWGLANNLVITTNYDKILNWTSPDKDNTENLNWDSYSELSRSLKGNSKRPKIWHFHGYIERPDSIILTSNAYMKLYSSEDQDQSPYRAALLGLQNIFLSHTILFVGFSFADPFIGRQLETIASAFDNKGEQNFGLFCEREKHKIEPLLNKLNVTPIYYEDYGEPLVSLLTQLTDCRANSNIMISKSEKDDLKQFVSPDSSPPSIPFNERWTATSVVRGMDMLGPTYILDKGYYFLDWNPAFELIFAKPLGLRLLVSNATDFIAKFSNREEVVERAKIVFPAGEEGPLVDIEPIYFYSEVFGLIEVKKIAARITDVEGKDGKGKPAWSVTLNIVGAEHKDKLWQELRRVLESSVNWSLYAANYDDLVCDFPPYQKLLGDVCGMLSGINNCVDLGAGTGNGTLKLLEFDPDRFVCAIEPNEEMLLRFKKKAERLSGQIKYVKQNLESLEDVPNSEYGGAIMINVLYAVDDPALALKEIARILEPGAVLALSTAHSGTDVKALFRSIRLEYIRQKRFPQKEAIIREALNRHDKMLHLIHRDSKDDIRRYLMEAGFDIEEWRDDQYEGAVVIVKAVKRS